MMSIEVLCNLVKEYNLSHTSLSWYLKTSKSQIGMTLRGLRDLPPHSEVLLHQLRDKLAKAESEDEIAGPLHEVSPEEKDLFRRRYERRLLDIESSRHKLSKKKRLTEKAKLKSKRELHL